MRQFLVEKYSRYCAVVSAGVAMLNLKINFVRSGASLSERAEVLARANSTLAVLGMNLTYHPKYHHPVLLRSEGS